MVKASTQLNPRPLPQDRTCSIFQHWILAPEMATNENLAASLNFMTDAAHLLSQAAPETSAHLMSQRSALMFHNNLERTELQQQRVCGSCGCILIPGGGSPLKLESDETRKARVGKSAGTRVKPPDGKKYKISTCQHCNRYTKINLPAAPSVGRNRIKLRQIAHRLPRETGTAPTASTVIRAPLSLPESARPSSNANSKKRAKNRKQGLQALLQQSQASTGKAGLGLSLTDFMKK